MTNQELLTYFSQNKSDKYNEFNSKIVNTSLITIGVNMKIIRQLVKDRIKAHDNLNNIELGKYYEVDMFYALYKVKEAKTIEDKISFLDCFIPSIDCWSICDCLAASIKCKNTELLLQKCHIWQKSPHEFTRRFAYVCMMDYYLDDNHIDKVLNSIKTDNEYYVRMGIAWLLSTCFIKFFDKTVLYLKQCKLDDWTINKSLQKAYESFRLSQEQKQYLITLKRSSNIE